MGGAIGGGGSTGTERDGGPAGPAARATAAEWQPAPSGCGCAVDPGQSPSGLALMLVAGGVVFSRRRRR